MSNKSQCFVYFQPMKYIKYAYSLPENGIKQDGNPLGITFLFCDKECQETVLLYQ